MTAAKKETTAAAKKEPAPLKVAKGRALCTKAGVKGEGIVITEDMVHGGAETLAALKAKGVLV